jgi:hypothetical protein
VVASKEELHAAALTRKRLLALWNALPSVEKRRKVGVREALINELWTVIEMLPDPERGPDLKPPRSGTWSLQCCDSPRVPRSTRWRA